jgi:hypothetical protein
MLREHDRVDFKFSTAFQQVWHLCIRDAQVKSMQHTMNRMNLG